jgi:hypothetical protein
MRCIKTDTPPELTERDKVVRKDLARIFHRKEVGGTAGRRVNSGV